MTPASLDGQLREMHGRAAYTHKTHEKMADSYVCRYRLLKTAEIALSAAATGSLLLAVFGDSHIGTIIGRRCPRFFCSSRCISKRQVWESKHNVTRRSRLSWGVREAILGLLIDMRDGRDLAEIRDEAR
jgi:hypothetical protein